MLKHNKALTFFILSIYFEFTKKKINAGTYLWVFVIASQKSKTQKFYCVLQMFADCLGVFIKKYTNIFFHILFDTIKQS